MENSGKRPPQLRIHTQYLVAITSIAKPGGWAVGDPITIVEENGTIVVENLTDPEIIAERVTKIATTPYRRRKNSRALNHGKANEIKTYSLDGDGFPVLGMELSDNAHNTIYSFSEELLAVRNGKPLLQCGISTGPRSRMYEEGVLIRTQAGTMLSSEGNKLLNEILSDPNQGITRSDTE